MRINQSFMNKTKFYQSSGEECCFCETEEKPGEESTYETAALE